MLWLGDRAAFASIGDSPASRLGDGELRRLGRDMRAGWSSPAGASPRAGTQASKMATAWPSGPGWPR